MTTGNPRTKRDLYRVCKRIHQGVRGTRDLADQLKLSPQTVAELKNDAAAMLWLFLVEAAHSAQIDELCGRDLG